MQDARLISVDNPESGIFFFNSDDELVGAIRTEGELFQCRLTRKPTRQHQVFELSGEGSTVQMTGTVFRNQEQEFSPAGNPKPIISGKIDVGGIPKRFAAWDKQGAKGPFITVKISPAA